MKKEGLVFWLSFNYLWGQFSWYYSWSLIVLVYVWSFLLLIYVHTCLIWEWMTSSGWKVISILIVRNRRFLRWFVGLIFYLAPICYCIRWCWSSGLSSSICSWTFHCSRLSHFIRWWGRNYFLFTRALSYRFSACRLHPEGFRRLSFCFFYSWNISLRLNFRKPPKMAAVELSSLQRPNKETYYHLEKSIQENAHTLKFLYNFQLTLFFRFVLIFILV